MFQCLPLVVIRTAWVMSQSSTDVEDTGRPDATSEQATQQHPLAESDQPQLPDLPPQDTQQAPPSDDGVQDPSPTQTSTIVNPSLIGPDGVSNDSASATSARTAATVTGNSELQRGGRGPRRLSVRTALNGCLCIFVLLFAAGYMFLAFLRDILIKPLRRRGT